MLIVQESSMMNKSCEIKFSIGSCTYFRIINGRCSVKDGVPDINSSVTLLIAYVVNFFKMFFEICLSSCLHHLCKPSSS